MSPGEPHVACPWRDALVKSFTTAQAAPWILIEWPGKIWQSQNEVPSTKTKASSCKTYQCCEMQRKAEDCFLMKGDWRHGTAEYKERWMCQTLNQRKQRWTGHYWHKQWNLTADQIWDYRATPTWKPLNVIIPRPLCKRHMLKHWRVKSHGICNLRERYILKHWRLKSCDVCNLVLNGWKNEQL